VKPKIALGAVLLVLVGGAVLTFFPREKVLAEVGTTKITDGDVRLAMKALEPLMQNVPTESAVLDRMIRGHSVTELLKLKGMNNLEEAFHQEIARFEGSPEKVKQLEETKRKLGNNPEKLKKLVLIPLAADRLAFLEGYLKDEDFNKEKRDKAEAFLKEAMKNPQRFSELAKKENLIVTEGRWVKGRGLILDDPQLGSFVSSRTASAAKEAEQQGVENLEKLAAGQVLDYVIDNRSGWWVIKSRGVFESRGGVITGIKLEAAVVKRDPFPLWLQKNARVVSVKRMTAAESESK
jgi:hypothetical protein